MIFDEDDTRVREACAKCMADPSNVESYDRLMDGSRMIGRNFFTLI